MTVEDPHLLAVSAASAGEATPAIAARIQALATELTAQTNAIADAITDRALAIEPRLADAADPIAREGVEHSTRDNVGAILSMLAYGIPLESIQPPIGALELFENAAEREDGLTVVLRGYRLGMAELWQIWAAHVRAAVHDADELHAILAASTSQMFAYIDTISERLIERWADTRRRRRQGLDVAPEVLISKALTGADQGDGLQRLGYAPGGEHLALALPRNLDDGAVAQLASRLRLIAAGRSVTMAHDGGSVVWLGTDAPLSPDTIAALEAALADLSEPVGRSESGTGIDGFRTAHREARDAQRVGNLRRVGGVTRHRDVALLSVLCADTKRARALARAELGPLVADDEVTERLRETLTAYLAHGESHVAAAHELFVHQKTVAYRVRQAEGLLGRKVGDRRAELEAALLLHRAFCGDV